MSDERRSNEHLSSTREASVNFFKSLFGAGILALPHAMHTVGLQLALCCYLLIAGLSCYTVWLLLESKRMASEQMQRKRRRPLMMHHDDAEEEIEGVQASLKTFEDLTGYLLGHKCAVFVALTICIVEICFCTGFIIVIIDNVQEVLPDVSREIVVGMLAPVLLLLGQIRWMADLCIYSFLGVVVYLVGVMANSVLFSLDHWQQPADLFVCKWENVLAFLGTATYALEGICLVLPVENSMEDKRKGVKMATGSLAAYGLLSGAYAAIAYGGGMGGDECKIVTDCLGNGSSATYLRVALAVALCLVSVLVS